MYIHTRYHAGHDVVTNCGDVDLYCCTRLTPVNDP